MPSKLADPGFKPMKRGQTPLVQCLAAHNAGGCCHHCLQCSVRMDRTTSSTVEVSTRTLLASASMLRVATARWRNRGREMMEGEPGHIEMRLQHGKRLVNKRLAIREHTVVSTIIETLRALLASEASIRIQLSSL